MEPLAHIATRHLEQIVLLELLEHATLQLDKLTNEQIGNSVLWFILNDEKFRSSYGSTNRSNFVDTKNTE